MWWISDGLNVVFGIPVESWEFSVSRRATMIRVVTVR